MKHQGHTEGTDGAQTQIASDFCRCVQTLFSKKASLLRMQNFAENSIFKNLLMPLFLMGCFPVDFQEVKRPLRTKSVKRPIKVGKRPINKGKRPIKAKVLVGVSVGCLMGCFRAPPPWRKTAPLKRPIKRSMKYVQKGALGQLSGTESRIANRTIPRIAGQESPEIPQ